MTLIPEKLPAAGRALAAVGLDPALPALRRSADGGIDYDWYLRRAGRLRADTFAESARALWRGLGAALHGSLKAIHERRRRQRAIAELLSLDERSLRDIGLSRAGVCFAVAHGREDVFAPANANTAAAHAPKAA